MFNLILQTQKLSIFNLKARQLNNLYKQGKQNNPEKVFFKWKALQMI